MRDRLLVQLLRDIVGGIECRQDKTAAAPDARASACRTFSISVVKTARG
jgi:hypothetical protein